VRLRRFAEHLRQQHWTAAVIELLIVVLGVFIGLQVSNWNEQRRDHALERQYLERLREDFLLSAKGAEDAIATQDLQTRLAGQMLERLQACRLDDSQRVTFAHGLYVLGRQQPPVLTRGTIDELRSTGRIGIIRSIGLRHALSDIVQTQDRTAEVFRVILERRTQPLAYIDARTAFLVTGASDAAPKAGEIGFDFPAMCHDPAFINYVSHLRQMASVVAGQNRRLLENYRAMVRQLEAELAKEPG
jgi:hypothetical protein